MKPIPTKTTNRIHFSDLEPMRFEDLCLNLIQRQRDWEELRHYGRKGNDDGIDILAIDKNSKIWYFQCKRYLNISLSELEKIIAKICTSNKTLPDFLVLFVSCDTTKDQNEKFIEIAEKNGIGKAQIWTSSIIESELYNKHHDLLFTYFGINIPKENKNNIARVRHSLRMGKRIKKDFIRKDLDMGFIMNISSYEPYCNYKFSKIIIRNIDNDTYPHIKRIPNRISDWFRTEIYDLYNNGIEIFLYDQHELIYDDNYYWDLLESEVDERRNRYNRTRVNLVARISYTSIIEYNLDGDDIYPEPHLFCKFDINNTPYESFEYYTYGSSQKKIRPYHFDKSMKTKLE